jgi:hypothetical protein
MLTEWELWGCANHYETRHGEDAAILAAMRSDQLFSAGDLEGARNFRAIVARINRLFDPPPENALN